MNDDPILLTEVQAGVQTLTLNRPDRLNALNDALAEALTQALKQAARDDSIRAVLLTGAGRGFCAGQDLVDVLAGQQAGEPLSLRDHLNSSYHPLIRAMRQLEKPIVGAINGAAAGAGLGLALACDLRLAAAGAKFRTAFVGIGLAPDSGVSYFLPRLVGPARAAMMAFTNEVVTAETAEQWGLINRVCPPDTLQNEARALAEQLAAGPTRAIGITKRELNRALVSDLDSALDYEARLQDVAARTPDFAEGVAAFLEKRTPNFSGQ